MPKGTSVSEILGKMGRVRRWLDCRKAERPTGGPDPQGRRGRCRWKGWGPIRPTALEILRHSAAHIMAQAVKSIFPEARIAIGPAIENGFYYDFDVARPFTQEDLEKIEARMREIASQKLPFSRRDVPREEAIGFFSGLGEKYKVELLEEFTDPVVSFYQQGDFIDLCRGPHIPHSGFLKAFKLTSVAGAYWRGDERNPMLQRIYGTAFFDAESLKKYLTFPGRGSKARSPAAGKGTRSVQLLG